MGAFRDALLSDVNRQNLIASCVNLIESEVSGKKGASGIMIRAAYKAFKSIKPKIVEKGVLYILDDFTYVLEQQYSLYLYNETSNISGFDEWLIQRSIFIAEDMLKITDNIIEKSNKIVLKKIYGKLRDIASQNVALAMPKIAEIIMKFLKK
ncbi:MAG: hypothetical protein HQK79_08080 [Desulfobacterales bacterium]|nr:hypothetical protein [Desulfobacterales bacterium]MBF0396677.1 hypothetical protein [Desulfobacterales bacterium]